MKSLMVGINSGKDLILRIRTMNNNCSKEKVYEILTELVREAGKDVESYVDNADMIMPACRESERKFRILHEAFMEYNGVRLKV